MGGGPDQADLRQVEDARADVASERSVCVSGALTGAPDSLGRRRSSLPGGENRSRMGTAPPRTTLRTDARAFGAYIRLLRENFHGKGRGKRLRQLSRETGIAPSVLSRGERGLQDLRQVEYIERLAPCLGVRPSVLKRVAALITPQDVEDFRRLDTGLGAADFRYDGASRLLWMNLTHQLQRLRGTSPETLEALLGYIEYLASRETLHHSAQGDALHHSPQGNPPRRPALGDTPAPAAEKIATGADPPEN